MGVPQLLTKKDLVLVLFAFLLSISPSHSEKVTLLNSSFPGLDSLQGSSLSLSRSSSREHLASGSESDNWRDRNGIGPMGHGDFSAPIGSPKRKQNKSSEHDFRLGFQAAA